MSRRMLLAGSVLTSVLISGAVAAALVASGSIDSNGAPTEINRLDRDGVVSTCGSLKAFPGVLGVGPFAYTTLSYTNGTAGCRTLSITDTCTNSAFTFLSAYSAAFDPNNLATGYLGDTGLSPLSGGPPMSMGLNLAAGQTITLVVNQVSDTTTNPVVNCSYAISDDIAAVTPTMSPPMLLLTALALALGFGFVRWRASRA